MNVTPASVNHLKQTIETKRKQVLKDVLTLKKKRSHSPLKQSAFTPAE